MHYSLYALLVDGVDGPGEGLHALEAVVVLHADDVVAGVAVVDGEEGHQRHPGSGVVRWPDGAETRSSKKVSEPFIDFSYTGSHRVNYYEIFFYAIGHF